MNVSYPTVLMWCALQVLPFLVALSFEIEVTLCTHRFVIISFIFLVVPLDLISIIAFFLVRWYNRNHKVKMHNSRSNERWEKREKNKAMKEREDARMFEEDARREREEERRQEKEEERKTETELLKGNAHSFSSYNSAHRNSLLEAVNDTDEIPSQEEPASLEENPKESDPKPVMDSVGREISETSRQPVRRLMFSNSSLRYSLRAEEELDAPPSSYFELAASPSSVGDEEHPISSSSTSTR